MIPLFAFILSLPTAYITATKIPAWHSVATYFGFVPHEKYLQLFMGAMVVFAFGWFGHQIEEWYKKRQAAKAAKGGGH